METERIRIERGVVINLNPRQKICVDCIVTPIFGEEHVKEVIVEMTDANAQERLMHEASQKNLQDTARESIQGMAHEIKNPLGGIRGAAQLLESELDDNSLKEYTHIIVNESDRLRKFIDKMLMPTKAATSKSEMNIHEVLEYVVSLVRAENTRPVKISKNYDPSIPAILADKEQLIQAALNLIRNAIQAIAENGSIELRTRVRRKVTINNQLNRHVVVLEIIDDGPGIPKDIEESAFYPMITGRAEGSGLGLTIAQQLVQSHNGMISYERENDKTYFTILLPVE
ncbi:MAG: nitrogen regulation protein NR(II) [Pseudomonadota bacterium]